MTFLHDAARDALRAMLVAGAIVAMPGCEGTFGGPSSGSESDERPGESADASLTEENGIIRLSQAEYVNTLHDLFGADLLDGVPIEAAEEFRIGEFYSIGARQVPIAESDFRSYATTAELVASRVVNSDTWRSNANCSPTGPDDVACAEQVLSSVGRRVFRRPLSDDELARYVAVAIGAAEDYDGFWKGIRFGLAGMLASPFFLYRVESGTPVGDRRIFDSYELATRLSFLLWDSSPDEALLDAAERDELTTPEGLARQVDRLLADETRFMRAVRAFMVDLMMFDEVESYNKNPDRFPSANPKLIDSMHEAVFLLAEEIAREDQDFLSILESNLAFVDARLAELYEVSSPDDGFAKISLPSDSRRTGLLTEPAFLASWAGPEKTSPTLRGRFVVERLLCSKISDPPPDVQDSVGDAASPGDTRRDELQAHVSAPACNACHQFMDPIGFGLEYFDALGFEQTEDNGAPIDATGEIDGAAFDGPRTLSKVVRGDARAAPCLVRNFYRYATGRELPAGDDSLLQSLDGAYAEQGGSLRALFQALALDESFKSRVPSE